MGKNNAFTSIKEIYNVWLPLRQQSATANNLNDLQYEKARLKKSGFFVLVHF